MLHRDTLMTSWGCRWGGDRIYMCHIRMTHSRPSNYIKDKWCYWYDNDSFPQHGNISAVVMWLHRTWWIHIVPLWCLANVTADTVVNESFILMTHLASWKNQWCVQGIFEAAAGPLNIYAVVLTHKDPPGDEHDSVALICMAAFKERDLYLYIYIYILS